MKCAGPIRDIDHVNRKRKKQDRAEGLAILLKMHEEQQSLSDTELQDLRRRLRLAQNQLRNMSP